MVHLTGLFVGLSLLANWANGQNDSPDNPANLSAAPPADVFYRRAAARVVVIGDYIYIDGGEVSQRIEDFDDDEPMYFPSNKVNRTLSIDLTKSWETHTVEMKQIDKNAPDRVGQSLFKPASKDRFWVWGGDLSHGIQPAHIDHSARQMWSFIPDGNGGGVWSNEEPEDAQGFSDLTRSGYGVFASAGDKGFHFGGQRVQGNESFTSDEMIMRGYLEMNFGDSIVTWENKTEGNPWASSNTVSLGRAEYVDGFGPNGLIFLIGGETTSSGPNFIQLSFANLHFMDPETNEWYEQTTTGDIPPRRMGHCAVVVTSQQGTQEILVYGGHDFDDNYFTDMYILSVPGFFWTKVNDTDYGGPRSHMDCAVIDKAQRQMLNVGGFNLGDAWTWRTPDNFSQGLGIFDLQELKWKSNFDPNMEDYNAPQVIQDWYSAHEGKSINWSSDKVKKLFEQKRENKEDEEDKKDNEEEGNGEESPDNSSGTPVGAIAGGVSAGVAVIGAAGAAFWFIRRRRRGQQAGSGPAGASQTEEGYGDTPANRKDPLTVHPVEMPDSSRMAELDEQRRMAELDEQRRMAELGDGRMAPELQGDNRQHVAELSADNGVRAENDEKSRL